MLRMVPLPRFAGEEPRRRRFQILPRLRGRGTGEAGGGGGLGSTSPDVDKLSALLTQPVDPARTTNCVAANLSTPLPASRILHPIALTGTWCAPGVREGGGDLPPWYERHGSRGHPTGRH